VEFEWGLGFDWRILQVALDRDGPTVERGVATLCDGTGDDDIDQGPVTGSLQPGARGPRRAVFGQVTLLYTSKHTGYQGGRQCARTIIVDKASFAGSGRGRSHEGQTY
jgi:hypothetical protein